MKVIKNIFLVMGLIILIFIWLIILFFLWIYDAIFGGWHEEKH